MNIQKIDMNQLIAKIVHNLDFQINETACEIHVNPLPECYGDAALLDQLFTNIISNALKYYDAERTLEITVEAKTIYNKVVYSISDTGKGMEQKYLDKIWNIFYRIDSKSGKAGEGLGLSLVKQIVEKHKGKIWVESKKNKGSVFHIELQNRTFTKI
jgi:signal transduction histidine kinase